MDSSTAIIMTTLQERGAMLLKDLGVSEVEASELVKAFQNDNFALVRAGYAERVKA